MQNKIEKGVIMKKRRRKRAAEFFLAILLLTVISVPTQAETVTDGGIGVSYSESDDLLQFADSDTDSQNAGSPDSEEEKLSEDAELKNAEQREAEDDVSKQNSDIIYKKQNIDVSEDRQESSAVNTSEQMNTAAPEGMDTAAPEGMDTAAPEQNAADSSETKKDEASLDNKQEGTYRDGSGLLSYDVSGGSITIISCAESVSGDLVIPSQINGMPVTAVDDYAFLYCAALTSVTFPSSVVRIGDSAFAYCTGLRSAAVEGKDVVLGKKAFYQCSALESVSAGGSSAATGGTAVGNFISIGDSAFESTGLTEVFFLNGAAEIGARAFYECKSLTKVRLPDGLKTIGSEAFRQCEKLEDIALPDGLTSVGDSAFQDCKHMSAELVIPDSLTAEHTGKNLFYDCYCLQSVKLPDTWTRIPEGMFYHCKDMRSISWPKQLKKIEANAFAGAAFVENGVTVWRNGALPLSEDGTLTIPEGVTEIGDNAFQWNGQITSVILPDSLTTLGKEAFSRCSSLSKADVPSGMKTVPDGAFSETALTKADWLVQITSIGSRAFFGCDFKEITLNADLQYVGYSAFNSCSTLEKVEFIKNGGQAASKPDTNSWGNQIFKDCSALTSVVLPDTWSSVPASLFSGCENLSQVSLKDNLIEIGDYAFYQCIGLKEISLPDSVTKIGASAFSGCSGLTSLTFPAELTTIGASAFSQTGLTSLNLPSGLTVLGESAFSECENLREVSITGDVEQAGKNAFAKCKSLENVTYRSGTTKTGEFWFSGCTALKTVNLPSSLRTISAGTFESCSALTQVALPSGLQNIEEQAFLKSGLEEAALPYGLKKIGAQAFAYTKLTKITLPSTLTAVYSRAFEETPLASVTISEGVPEEAFEYPVEIGGSTKWNGVNFGALKGYAGRYVSSFYNCKELTHIDLPKSWTRIPAHFLFLCGSPLGEFSVSEGITAVGEYAFAGCSGLTGIRLPSSLTEVGAYAFYQSGLTAIEISDNVAEENFGEYAVGNCTALTSIKLPSSWTKIPEGLLQGNISMETYEIPEGIVEIGVEAFRDSAIKSVKLPSTLKTIGQYAFAGSKISEVTIPGGVQLIDRFTFVQCDELKTVVLGSGVTALEGLCFAYCSSLEEVEIPDSVTKISTVAFYGSNPGKVHISASRASQAEKFAEAVLYVYSDYSQIPYGAEFSFQPFSTTSTATYDYGPEYWVKQQGLEYEVSLTSTTNTDGNGNPLGGGTLWMSNCSLDFQLTLVGFDASVTDLVVSDTLFGIPVTAVSISSSRYDYENQTDVASDNSSLQTIRMGANVTNVRIQNCDSLVSVDFANAPVTYVTVSHCTALTSIDIPATVRRIGDGAGAFDYCTSLSSVTFHEGLEIIYDRSFSSTALTEVWLPASLKVLQPDAFDPDVILHFTGDASKVTYSHVGDDLMVVYDSVLPALIQKGFTIAQFSGEGLDKQGSYYRPASEVTGGTAAPAAAPSADPAAGAVRSGSDTDAEPSLLPETADAAETALTPAPLEDADGSSDELLDDEDSEGGDDMTVYEVISHVVEENPWLAAFLVILLIAVVAAGGMRRYRKVR